MATTAGSGSTSEHDAATGLEGRRAQRRGRAVVALALCALAGFALLTTFVALGDTTALDVRATVAWQEVEIPGLLRLMVWVSWFGFSPQSTILGLGLIGGLFAGRLRLESGFTLLAFLSTFLSGIVKGLVHRQRPSAGLDGIVVRSAVGGYSFPSGHVLTYVVLGGFLAYLAYTLIRQTLVRRVILTFLLGLIVLVGPSRVYLGQHWLTDTLASYCLGVALLTVLLALYRAAKGRQLAGAAR